MIKLRSVVSFVAVVALTVVFFAASPVLAAECQGQGYRWTVRGVGAKVQSNGDPFRSEQVEPLERLKFDLNSGEGVGAELEYRVNCPVGLAFGLMDGSLDSMAVFDTEFEWLMDHDDVDFQLATLGVNFHLAPRSRADFFIGPFVGLIDYDDVNFDSVGIPFETNLDGDTVIGVNAGVDLPLTADGPWAFTAGLRYLSASADGPGFGIDIDPLIATAGIAYRWNGKKCGPCAALADSTPTVEPEPAPEPVAPPPPPPAPAPPAVTKAPASVPPPAPAPAVVEREVCHFATNGSRVSNICKAKLDEVALKLKQDPALGAEIVGHADSTGNDRINDPLSSRRAEAVKTYLVDRHGIDGDRISTSGVGSREPAAANDTADGRAENRRAVVVISLS